MIKSESGLGLIYAGSTPLAFTATLSQTAPDTLALSSGLLTLTNGENYPIPALSIVLPNGISSLYLGLLAGTLLLYAAPPLGIADPTFAPIQMVAGFGVGIEVKDGAIVGDVYVLTVLPGFPEP